MLIHPLYMSPEMLARLIELYKEHYSPRFYLHDFPPGLGSPGALSKHYDKEISNGVHVHVHLSLFNLARHFCRKANGEHPM